MGFIAQANDISSVTEKAGRFSELLDGSHIETSALVGRQFSGQVLTILNSPHGITTQIFCRFAELLVCLILQIFSVYDKQNRGIPEVLLASHSQQARKEQHGVGLAAARCAEISATLTITAHASQML